MAFDDVPFPMNIAVGLRSGPEREVEIVGARAGLEVRNLARAASRRRYEIAIPADEAPAQDALLHFWEGRRAALNSFPLLDPGDHKSSAPGTAIAATDQAIGTGDDSTVAFQLVKVYDLGGNPWSRTLLHPITATVLIALDGTPILASASPFGWSVSRTTGLITFNAPPAGGVAITAGFHFHTTVRFERPGLIANWTVGAGAGFTDDATAVADFPDLTMLEVLGE